MLGEAYAAYFLADSPPPTFNYSIMGEGIQQFMWGSGDFEQDSTFDYRSVAAVDNIPGALQGDYGTTQIKTITRNFRKSLTLPSIAGFNNTLELAQNILAHDVSEVDKAVDEVKRKFEQGSSVRNTKFNENLEEDKKLMTKRIMEMDKSEVNFEVYLGGK